MDLNSEGQAIILRRTSQEPAMPIRRHILAAGVGGAAMLAAYPYYLPGATAADERFQVTHSDAEGRTLLTPAQYDVLRRAGTERPFSSPLDHEHPGRVFACAGLQPALFS